MTLHYQFPHIESIADVLPHIEGNPSFIVVKKDYGVTIINYAFQTTDTFPSVIDNGPADDPMEVYDLTAAMRRECRGLIFHTDTGKLVRRAFHKFFNYGEKHDVSALDLERPHGVVEKLDGSMITPLPLPDGTIRWASKMGITEVSMQAETFIASKGWIGYEGFARHMIEQGKTPIFEWCSRQQRIVVDYPQDQLVLLAVRDNLTGCYDLPGTMLMYSMPPVRRMANKVDDLEGFVAEMRAQEGIEGAIIMWEDGHMVKIKADAYVTLHRAKSMIERERDVVALMLNEKLDDLIPLLSDDDKRRLAVFTVAVGQDILSFTDCIWHELDDIREQSLTRREFALRSEEMSPPLRAAVFRLFDQVDTVTDNDINNYVKQHILKLCTSRSTYLKAKDVLRTAKWSLWGAIGDEMQEAA